MLASSTPIEVTTMATKNPRVVGYIQPETHAKLKQYMEEHNVSESKALDLILGEFFGVDVPRVAFSSTPDIDSRIDEAIAPLRAKLDEIEARLSTLETQQPGKLTRLHKKRVAS